jgi:hypothetical protein
MPGMAIESAEMPIGCSGILIGYFRNADRMSSER